MTQSANPRPVHLYVQGGSGMLCSPRVKTENVSRFRKGRAMSTTNNRDKVTCENCLKLISSRDVPVPGT